MKAALYISLAVMVASSLLFPVFGYLRNRPPKRTYGIPNPTEPAFFVDMDPAHKPGRVVPFGKRKIKS